ncbi:hypothetical protein EASAB2608_00501 [Streptomyces sp. EAS-AB2608]|nr:hypothetical protein EASAB2608_00501 [Streptomyces sp. EAS-AB2608]
MPPDAGAWARPCTERRPCTAERGRSRERVHRQLTEAATAWQQLDRDGGALHRGVRLTLATGLDRPSLTDLESASSMPAWPRAQQRKRRSDGVHGYGVRLWRC